MRFHLVYRTAPGDTRGSDRPAFYSKDLALESCLAAASALPPGDRIFVCDGELAEPRASRIAAAGEVLQLGGVGNSRSYRACVALVETRAWDDDDIVYFAEDDYLYTDDAFARLVAAVDAIPEASYFTLYDHPDYYTLRLHKLFSARHRSRRQVGHTTWRDVRSTTLTYAARVGAIRGDAWIHHLCSRAVSPSDFAIFSIIEGAGGYLLQRLLKPSLRPEAERLLRKHVRRLLMWDFERNRLYAATPAPATHLQIGMLAPGVDWAAVARAHGDALAGASADP